MKKRKSQIPGKPVQAVEHAGMDEKIINSAQNRPEKGKQGTDETLHISPQAGVVPQANLEKLQAEQARQIFNQGHSRRHEKKQQCPVPEGILNQAEPLQRGQQKQKAQPKPIDWQVGAGAEAGVDPLAVLLSQVSVEQLQNPAKNAADEE